MCGLKDVQTRGFSKESKVDIWLTYDADKGGGTVTHGGTSAVAKSKPVNNDDQVNNPTVETLLTIPRVCDVMALDLEGEVCVKLEDDQGGGIVYTTETLEKQVHQGCLNTNSGGHGIHIAPQPRLPRCCQTWTNNIETSPVKLTGRRQTSSMTIIMNCKFRKKI